MMGRATKTPTRMTSLSVSEAPRRRSLRHPVVGVGELLGFLASSPAITEGLIVIDLGKGGVDGSELVSNPLDARADVRSVAIFSAPRDEPDIVHAIVDSAVGHVVADVRRQQMHDLELGERQADIGVVPVGAAHARLEQQSTTV